MHSCCLQPDTVPGDVIVVLQQQEHEVFRREGNNCLMKKSITLLEALTDFAFQIKHLDGRVLIVKSDPGQITKPGDVKAIRDQGFPFHKNPVSCPAVLIRPAAAQTILCRRVRSLSASTAKATQTATRTPSNPLCVS